MKFLSIFVGFIAIFIGFFVYKFYLPISAELTEDSVSFLVLHNAAQYFGRIAEYIGLASRAVTLRAILDTADRLSATELESIIEDTMISGVPVKIFRPRKGQGESQAHPGLIFFHAGGFVIGNVNGPTYQRLCSMFSNATNSIVISVDYRLAPEHLFPAQFNDGYSVVSAVIDNPTNFGIIKDKLVIGGDSAGGLLTAAISIELSKQNKSHHIAAQLLIYPWLQLIDVIYLPSYQKYTEGFALSQEEVTFYALMTTTGNLDLQQEYLSGNVSRYFMCTPYWTFLEIPRTVTCETTSESLPPEFVQAVTNPRLSPLLAESVEGLPPTFIAMPEYDILASECEAFASRLKESGVQVVHERYKTYHAFVVNAGQPHLETDVVKKAIDDMINYLNIVFYNNQ